MSDKTTEVQNLGLAELMQALSDELHEAQEDVLKGRRKASFKLKEASIQVGITWTKSGSGELNFQVVKLGGDVTKANTETLTVVLEPAEGVGPMEFPSPPSC